ncbi:carboxypeptidase-like regulatory domain-containing protein [Pedobacter insulae]|uniref:CarboxypepD_reg-like domain-containing protein n=1 Tax=Pedobacter insulae TaxID=414048 RepID=A0A1I2WUY8_9SPHI|nr:carboxypeptidase-like regulatory domain-containing protein [Pedobacter insulae]SFH03441.1 CarboxypepD_reg-like domain-containing protein [Pedobacter insulae]
MNLRGVLLLTLLCPFIGYAQIAVRGLVVDEATGKPIENASVYYNNTKLGTMTNTSGAFLLYAKHPQQDLVISSIGYEKVVMTILDKDSRFKIVMKPRVQLLNEVVISDNKFGWKRWGTLFFKGIMGDDSHDYPGSYIVNPEVLNFYFDRSTNILTVNSSDPVIIEHPELGYTINLDLANFEYDLISEKTQYFATTFYVEKFDKVKAENIQLTTNRAYLGSRDQFLRALYHNKLEEEGFKLYTYRSVKNLERQRVEEEVNRLRLAEILKGNPRPGFRLADLKLNKDTLKYYQKILGQPGLISRNLRAVSLDSMLFSDAADNLKTLKFKDSILVTHGISREKAIMHTNFRNHFPSRRPDKPLEETVVFLVGAEEFQINEWGQSLSNSLQMNGFMGQRRLARTLPSDFDPKIPRKPMKK